MSNKSRKYKELDDKIAKAAKQYSEEEYGKADPDNKKEQIAYHSFYVGARFGLKLLKQKQT